MARKGKKVKFVLGEHTKRTKLKRCSKCSGNGRKIEQDSKGRRYYVTCSKCGGDGWL